MHRSGAWRSFATLWAILQFVLPGATLLADARLERDAVRSPGSHIESKTTPECHPVHQDQCALCQVLSNAAAPSESPALPAIALQVRPVSTSPVPRHATRDLADVGQPRAPPTLG
jgi:hypothetical protein